LPPVFALNAYLLDPAAPFLDDVHHTAGCFRSVERRGRGPLEHLDALDLFRIEVVEAADQPRLIVVGANAVHVDERRVTERERADPAHADLRPGADLAGGR